MAANNGESRSAIAALHARGWTDSAIGRAVGRDSSLIHQIGAGKKPGNNLAGTLGALRDSGAAAPKSAKSLPALPALPSAPRRQTAQGMPARVRLPRSEQGTRGPRLPPAPKSHDRRGRGRAGHAPARELPNGARRIEGHTKASARFAAGLAADLSPNARVKIAYRDKAGNWHTLGQKGGLRPDLIRRYLSPGRSWLDVLADLIELMYKRRPGDEDDELAPDGEAEFYIVGLGDA